MGRHGSWLLYNRIPLVGGWLRRGEAARIAADKSPAAARALAEAITQSDDHEVRAISLQALQARQDQPSIDAVCEAWAESRSDNLLRILRTNGWVAGSPLDVRILTALKMGRSEVVVIIPAAGVGTLIQACSDRDQEVSKAACAAIVALLNPDAIDRLCQLWADRRDEFLERVVTHARYVARTPLSVRILSALRTEARQLLESASADAVPFLVTACFDNNQEIVTAARKAIVSLTNPEAITRVCQMWADSRHDFLDSVVAHAKYVAREPLHVQILSALRTGALEPLKQAGAEVVPVLLKACSDSNGAISQAAPTVLRNLRNRESQDALCRLAIDQQDAIAETVAKEAKYAPRDEHDRALFFFLTEQWERYEDLDFDRHLLRSVYEAATSALKARITERLRKAGRTDFLTILSGGDIRFRAGVMTQDESEFIIQMLAKNREWDKLWFLALELSFFSCVKTVRLLADSKWLPATPVERELLAALVSLVQHQLPTAVEEVSAHIPPALSRATARVSGRVSDVAFSPTKPWIAIGGKHQVVVWNFQKGETHESYRGFKRSVGSVVFTQDNELVCTEGGQQGRESLLHCWSHGQRYQVQQSDMITSLSPAGGSKVLVTRYDNRVLLWDAATRSTLKESGLPFWPRASRVATDGAEALLLHQGVTLVGLPEITIRAETNGSIGGGVSKCAAFSPDGKSQIIGNFNGGIYVTTRNGGGLTARRRVIAKCDGVCQGVEVLCDQRIVIVAGSHGRVDFISWENEALIGSVTTTGRRLTSLHISPAGDFMALGDNDATMSFWDLRVIQVPLLFALPFSKARPAHLAAVQALTKDHGLKSQVRHAVLFMERMLEYRFRYDIEIDEVPSIRVGEFDIEIE